MEKRLYRSKTDVKICGVCAGIAEYFNIDATVIRLLWILVSLLTGTLTGIIAYAICAFVIPEDTGFIDAEYKEK